MLYHRIVEETQRIQKQILSTKEKLLSAPNGKLFCAKNGNHFKWYHSLDSKQIYIPKKNRAYAEQLALKKYYSLLLEDLEQELTALNFYLRHHHSDYGKSALLLTKPGYQELLSSHCQPLSSVLSEWMNSPYDKNPLYPEQLTYKTPSGSFVRSKSEVFIDMLLFTNHIPFRYEYALTLGDSIIYPDFTIRHPDTGETFYWEHFGMMDNPKYAKNAFAKLQLYATYNLIPSINLITTYETRNHPLNLEIIETILHYYFL